MAYASHSLRRSERNCPVHKLEFLALKWSVTDKFHDYLYGADFKVVTDNNPLTYVFTTAKLDATSQRWLAELSNYNCTLSYRSGKQNVDADGLSRVHEPSTTRTIFPDVLKAICHSISVADDQPCINTLVDTQNEEAVDPEEATFLTDEQLQGTAHDWRGAQSSDPSLKFVIDCLIENRKPTTEEAEIHMIDRRYVYDWEQYKLIDGV